LKNDVRHDRLRRNRGMKFTYRSGHRPLDGYTLKRGVGRGGFGEVYFAVSDGGKEVALKLVRGGNSEAELRGVRHCLNLKHPNLVALYDLRLDADANPWVVMEYVAGETLSAHLSRNPDGLPVEVVREWFGGLARAVGYLHDHGIIHRDLKPANIFIEQGVVKVGDYGLTKSVSTSQGQAQTQSVGTVHYMAPEIGKGKYGKSVDVYAAAIILYEMLTGEVPFRGESAHEILARHQFDPPEMARVPEPFVPVLRKALAKDPEQRYASLSELGRAVEAAGLPPPAATALPMETSAAQPPIAAVTPPFQPTPPRQRQSFTELFWSLALVLPLAFIGTLVWAIMTVEGEPAALSRFLFLSVFACWAVLLPARWWTQRSGSVEWRRLVMLLLGGMVGLIGLLPDVWMGQPAAEGGLKLSVVGLLPLGNAGTQVGYLVYFAAALAVMRWWLLADRHRPSRFSLAPVLAAAFWGLVLLLLARTQPWLEIGVLVLTALVVQLVSPWEPRPRSAQQLRPKAA
jgi:hypothetical protein